MVFGQMNEPPGNRLRVALTGLTMAEKIPRRRPRSCSSLTTFTATRWPVHRSVRPAPAACRPPWATSRRWPKKWAACRSASRRPRLIRSSIRAVRACRRRPIRRRDHLPACRTPPSCCRVTSRMGIFPAVDRSSTSRQIDPLVIGEQHYACAFVRPRCNATRNSATSRFWAWTNWHPDKLAVAAPAQNPAFPVAAVPRRRVFTGSPGKVRVARDTIRGFNA